MLLCQKKKLLLLKIMNQTGWTRFGMNMKIEGCFPIRTAFPTFIAVKNIPSLDLSILCDYQNIFKTFSTKIWLKCGRKFNVNDYIVAKNRIYFVQKFYRKIIIYSHIIFALSLVFMYTITCRTVKNSLISKNKY